MAARTTTGAEWPCGEGRALQGNVILLTAEDDISDTVVPRLLAAGADLSCIEIVRMVRTGDKRRMFSLVTDIDLLRQKIAEVGNVKLIQIDPITAYLGVGKIDSFRTTDVRAVLGPLVELAAELMVSIIGIMHFNKKIDVTNALLRLSDSLAFGATARHVYAVIDDAENKRKLFVKGKNNLAPDNIKALAFGFGVREIGHDRKTGKPINAPHIVWHPKHVDVTATEAMQAAAEAKSPAARDSAKKFLAELLADGPVLKRDIEEATEGNGIARRTLFRAKAELGVLAKKDAPNGGWTWCLPPTAKYRNSDD
jgi:putative DNA primase/helicase